MRQKLYRFHHRLAVSRHRQTRRLRLWSRHPFAVPIGAFVFLALLTGGLLWLAMSRGASLTPPPTDIVIISYDHQTQTVPSHEATVGALLTKLKIPINPGDVVEPALSTPIHQDDFRINIYRAVPVKIIDAGQASFSYSAATTPRSVAEQAGVTVYPEDHLTTEPVSNILEEGTIGNVIIVDQSTPVTLSMNGFTSATRTLASTVGSFLTEKKIKLASNDTVEPAVSSAITANETISIIRNGIHSQSVEQTIPMPVQYIDDSSLSYGTYAIVQTGSPGQQVLTYQVNVENGQVVSQTLIQSVVTVQPVAQIVDQGTNLSGIKGDMALAGISPSDYEYADYIISNESGWCPTKWQGEYGYCPPTFEPLYSVGSAIGYGLGQSTPPDNMAAFGSDWETDPITQLEWANAYATSHYGSWAAAYNHWVDYHWW
jgi:uncharacterized protein YabE (DUF348 family)